MANSWKGMHFFSFISKSFLHKRQKKPIKDQRNEGLKPKSINDKLWDYQNQNVWMTTGVSYTMI